MDPVDKELFVKSHQCTCNSLYCNTSKLFLSSGIESQSQARPPTTGGRLAHVLTRFLPLHLCFCLHIKVKILKLTELIHVTCLLHQSFYTVLTTMERACTPFSSSSFKTSLTKRCLCNKVILKNNR